MRAVQRVLVRSTMLLLLAWQVIPLVLSAFATINPGMLSRHAIGEGERMVVQSLVAPAEEERRRAAELLKHYHSWHESQHEVLTEVFRRLLAGDPRELVLAEAATAEQRGLILAPVIPARPNPDEYALDALRLGYAGDDAVTALDRLLALPAYADEKARQAVVRDQVNLLIASARYADAKALVQSAARRMPWEWRLLQTHLEAHLRQQSFQSRLALTDLVARDADLERNRGTILRLYWQLYADCSPNGERALVVARLAGFMGDGREYREAAARIADESAEGREARSQWIALQADEAEQRKEPDLALALYGAVGEHFRGTKEWGRCAFNEALLLRRTGHPGQAIQRFQRIFPSSANDHDPGPDLMTAYRNYRHRSAIEISTCYSDVYDFPSAYIWQWRAAERYRYQSWCGTCRWGAEASLKRDLLLASLKAGPAFLFFNCLTAPLRYWNYWIGLAVVVWIGRRVRRRRRLRCSALPNA